ncbi:N-terminal amidase [Blastomyces gilchristii SLH14081]|uniref:N-terminal amidase n=1 Tax=Blastomyces gilchristii (strain SLH14081) TaxID=559298 RepID=A0A179UYU9_BLAGS|nr:N-terminal amidase [Blastomyces gilchristii SLH14081]OAT13256.1 N-terminal amidase [Blastomyces gilchristii SLH14081]
MRIATLQLSPRRGDVEGNIRRANALVDDLDMRLMRLKRGAQPDGGSSMPAGSGVSAGALAGLLDVLVLPEMAFTGYNFPSLEAIRPYLEPTTSGPTAEWARSAARRLGCVVCVGYPELAEAQSTSPATSALSLPPLRSDIHAAMRNKNSDEPAKADRHHTSHGDGKENKPIADVQRTNDDGSIKNTTNEESNKNSNNTTTAPSRFNSALLVSPTGSTLYNYQKRFLYYTDEPWAAEGRNGKGFLHLQLPSTTTSPDTDATTTTAIPTAIGICMDINPYKFLAPWTVYEFATHVLASGARLVLLPMAWLTLLKPGELGEGEGEGERERGEEEKLALARRPDMETFRYWLLRFWPLVRAAGKGEREGEGEGQGEAGMVILVFANRVGVEEGGFRIGKDGDGVARYAGSSCIVGIRRGRREDGSESWRAKGESGGEEAEILVWEMLGRAEEGVCFVDTEAEPKYVFRMREPGGDEA